MTIHDWDRRSQYANVITEMHEAVDRVTRCIACVGWNDTGEIGGACGKPSIANTQFCAEHQEYAEAL